MKWHVEPVPDLHCIVIAEGGHVPDVMVVTLEYSVDLARVINRLVAENDRMRVDGRLG